MKKYYKTNKHLYILSEIRNMKVVTFNICNF